MLQHGCGHQEEHIPGKSFASAKTFAGTKWKGYVELEAQLSLFVQKTLRAEHLWITPCAFVHVIGIQTGNDDCVLFKIKKTLINIIDYLLNSL